MVSGFYVWVCDTPPPLPPSKLTGLDGGVPPHLDAPRGRAAMRRRADDTKLAATALVAASACLYAQVFDFVFQKRPPSYPLQTRYSMQLAFSGSRHAFQMQPSSSVPAPGGGGTSDNVKVCVRVRPVTAGDTAWQVGASGAPTLSTLDVKGKVATNYQFGACPTCSERRRAAVRLTHARAHPHADHVFDESTTSKDLFDASVKGMVRSVVDGYNGTVFAYGQTAAGKTHTMQGEWGGGEGECAPKNGSPAARKLRSRLTRSRLSTPQATSGSPASSHSRSTRSWRRYLRRRTAPSSSGARTWRSTRRPSRTSSRTRPSRCTRTRSG